MRCALNEVAVVLVIYTQLFPVEPHIQCTNVNTKLFDVLTCLWLTDSSTVLSRFTFFIAIALQNHLGTLIPFSLFKGWRLCSNGSDKDKQQKGLGRLILGEKESSYLSMMD